MVSPVRPAISRRLASSARSAAGQSFEKTKTSSTSGSIRDLAGRGDGQADGAEMAGGRFTSKAVEQRAAGWVSLACAVTERGRAPFRTVISHGLTVDEQGRKMSKSLGNWKTPPPR